MNLLRYFSPRSGGGQQAQQSWEASVRGCAQICNCMHALRSRAAQSDQFTHSRWDGDVVITAVCVWHRILRNMRC